MAMAVATEPVESGIDARLCVGGIAAVAPLVSIVVPCLNEEECLPIFLREANAVVDAMRAEFGCSFEYVFVDDGSTDGTLDVIRRAAAEAEAVAQADAVVRAALGGSAAHAPGDSLPTRVRWVSFSRNFGKEAALLAGLQTARGDYVATMDADLQDPPSLLPAMYRMLQEGDCDNVACRRATRAGEPVVRSVCSRAFYRVMGRISGTEFVEGARDFRLMRRAMVDAVVSMGERNRFSKGLYAWVGFRTAWISYDNVERVAGTTKWSFGALARYSINAASSFSTAPLTISSALSALLCAGALIGAAVIAVRKLAFGDPVDGWASLACIVLFVGGLQLLCIGIVGHYLAKTYLETKRRPAFIVRESHV